jgi:hypothetical protein
VIEDLVVEIEPTEPTVSEMHFDLLAQPPLKPDTVAVAHDPHLYHQLPAPLEVEIIERSTLIARLSTAVDSLKQ